MTKTNKKKNKMFNPNELNKNDLFCISRVKKNYICTDDVYLFQFSENSYEKNKLFFGQRLRRNFKEKIFEIDNIKPENFTEKECNFFKYKGDFKYSIKNLK